MRIASASISVPNVLVCRYKEDGPHQQQLHSKASSKSRDFCHRYRHPARWSAMGMLMSFCEKLSFLQLFGRLSCGALKKLSDMSRVVWVGVAPDYD